MPNAGPESGRVPDQYESALVRHVEPLVGVGGDRVGPLHARGEVCGTGGQRGEDAECAIDVQPGAELPGQVGEVRQRVERRRVRLTRRGDEHGGRAVELGQPASQRGQVDPADVVAGEDLDRVLAVAEQLQAPCARWGARARRTGPASAAGRPARSRRCRRPCRSPHQCVARARPVRLANVALDGQRAAPARRQPEQVAQPVQRHRLHRVGEPRRRAHERVLVQHGHDPVGRQRGRRRAADHEVVEARTGRGRRGGGADAQERLAPRTGCPGPCSGSGPPSSRSSGSAARSYTSRSGSRSRYGPAASYTIVEGGQGLRLLVEGITHPETVAHARPQRWSERPLVAGPGLDERDHRERGVGQPAERVPVPEPVGVCPTR